MRNIVFLGFLALVVFLIAGWFLDWYSIKGAGTSGGKTNFSVEFDSNKFNADLQRGKQKLADTIDSMSKEKKEEFRSW
jgi:hypothetical protein